MKDCGLVAANMLWPDDAAVRSKFMLTVEAECYASMDDPSPVPVPLTVEETKQLAFAVRNAPRLIDYQQDARRRFVHGFAAGHRVLRGIQHGAAKPIRDHDQRFCNHLLGTYQIRPKTIDNEAWPKFKSVSHFWAAWIAAPDFTAPFFVHPSSLDSFLRSADDFRIAAESTRVARSRRTILIPGEALSVNLSRQGT